MRYPLILVHPVRKPVTARSPDEEQQWVGMGYEPVRPAEYSEFPKSLVHPDHAPARMVSAAKYGAAVSSDYPEAALARLHSYVPAVWEPERYPPVIARNAEEEEEFVAKGYRAPGTPDATAFSAATSSPSTSREIQQYPKWITPPHKGEPVLVKSATEENHQHAQWGSSKRVKVERESA